MTVGLPTIEDLGSLRGKRVLVRVDFNVPLRDRHIAYDKRIVKALPTILALRGKGARVICMSHLGRPKGGVDPALTMRPVARRLAEHLGTKVELLSDCVGVATRKSVMALKDAEVCLLENLRFHPEEQENDPEFARVLASLGDAYINDAFGCAHRAHASLVGVPLHLPSAAGQLMCEELKVLSRVRDDPPAPLVLILGGAKVAEKVPVIRHFLGMADRILIGGGMAYTLLEATGLDIGASRVESGLIETAREIFEEAAEVGTRLVLPIDHLCAESLGAIRPPEIHYGAIPKWLMGLDLGPLSADLFAREIRGAGSVIWNGPMGVFERPEFCGGTRTVAGALATLPEGTVRVVGGGDTAAAVRELGFLGCVGYLSTGGGASLMYLGGSDLVGVVALQRG